MIADEAWIDTVRLARDFGTVRELLPEGITDLRDLPFPLFQAINRASMILSFDELPADDRPPKRIWLDNAALNEHFEEVRRRHKREAEGKGSGSIEDPVDNDAAKGLIVG